jgi:NAD(P)H-hydrate epimerase
MQKILTTQEAQAIDKKSLISQPNQDFMKIAAEGLAEQIAKLSQEVSMNDISLFPFVTIVCGKGNNGGDGFKLASLLISKKYNLKIFSLAKPEQLQGDAFKAYLELKESTQNMNVDMINFIQDFNDIKNFSDYIETTQVDKEPKHIIIDALLGIGIKGPAKGLIAKMIEAINSTKKQNPAIIVLACDCPSGIDLDSNLAHQKVIKADFTVTMGFPKLASCFYPAKYFFGKQFTKPIPYPEEICMEEHQSRVFKITLEDIHKLLPCRNQEGSKYDHGTATIIAGSDDMPGAGFLTALAAMRSGLGLVHLYTQQESKKIISAQSPEIITHDIKNVNKKIQTDIISIGPGLGRGYDRLIQKIILESSVPIILDADGINAFKGKTDLLQRHSSPLIITPHIKEYSRLFPNDSIETLSPFEKIKVLKMRAKELNVIILLKGPCTIIVDPDGDCFLNDNGNSALATAGSGDVLTGIMTGIAGQLIHTKRPYFKNLLMDTAIISAYFHGLAGTLASQELTEYSVMARDIINKIHYPFAKSSKAFLDSFSEFTS